jgi:hypothetical protein
MLSIGLAILATSDHHPAPIRSSHKPSSVIFLPCLVTAVISVPIRPPGTPPRSRRRKRCAGPTHNSYSLAIIRYFLDRCGSWVKADHPAGLAAPHGRRTAARMVRAALAVLDVGTGCSRTRTPPITVRACQGSPSSGHLAGHGRDANGTGRTLRGIFWDVERCL